MMKPRIPITALVLLTAALTAIGLIGGDPRTSSFPIGASAASAKPAVLFDLGGCRELGAYLYEHRKQIYWGGGVAIAAEGDFAAGGSDDSSAAPPTTSNTGTNVQEAGVDEPDTVKLTDFGLVALEEGRLHSVITGAGDPVVADTLDLNVSDNGGGGGVAGSEIDFYYGGGPTGLLIHEDRIVVFGQGWNEDGSTVTLTEVDASDPAALEVVKTTELEGSYVSSRLTGSTARVVVSAYPDMQVLKRDRSASRRWLPAIRTHEVATDDDSKQPLVGCDEVDRPRRFSGGGLLTVLTLDLADGTEVIDSDAVLTDADTVYASTERLYVATQRWIWGDYDEDRDSSVNTQIHAFSTTDPTATDYVASGRVPGFMLSQWSMSEHDGFLRVASTTSPPWSEDGTQQGESESLVTVLGELDGKLVEAGRLGGLGLGEQIYAVRFFGDVGYVVTFRQVDPLYAIDLSDPSAPRLAGELKIPGYSAYLHPFGDDRLVGLGQDADGDGRTQGAQLSLFDISNLSAPARIAIEPFGRHSYSEVEYDHHAFFLDQESGVAVVPISDWGGQSGDEFYGAVGVAVSSDGLSEIARLEHGSGWRAAITRTIAREGSLFTVSAKGVMSHDPITLAETGWVRFATD